MKKKQVLLWLVPVMLVAGVLSGCDGGDESGVDGYGVTPPPNKKPKNPVAPEAENQGVTVSPGAVTVGKGVHQRFTAARTDSGAEGTFTWTVEGGAAEDTSIDENGVLTVGAGETAETLTVKAALKEESGKYGTATALVLSAEGHGLRVSPELVLLGRGEEETFTAERTAEIIGDEVDQESLQSDEEKPPITWSVDDSAGSAGSSETFPYTVGDEEAEEVLTVKASVSDEVYGAALITVLGGEEEGIAPIPVNYGIRVAPQSGIIEKGASRTFNAYEWSGSGESVVTSGLEWDVFGGGAGTSIDGGVLTVAELEEAEYLTVRAKNLSGAGTAVVKVSAAGDIDGDGIPNGEDPDVDGDGIPNGEDTDVDGDGIPNGEDPDIDGDGTPNGEDPDVDGDGIPNVTLSGVSANGTANSVTTTELTLNFDSPGINGLAADDITLSPALTKGTLSGSGTQYTLPVSGISAETSVTVTVNKAGYSVSGNGKTVTVHYVTRVEMTVTANGSSTTTTTALTLSFSPGISGLAADDITISAGSTRAVRGTLSGSNTPYTLTLSGIKAGGSITVSVSKSGYSVARKPVTVYYYLAEGEAPPSTITIGGKSLKQEFSITTTGTTGVRDTFNAVSAFIKNNSLNNQTKIQLGDYIDLEGGLTVAAYGSGSDTGAISISSGTGQGQASWRITTTSSMSYNPNYESVYLRLIVVGINSFNGKNGNSKNHVVFQFQNIPGTRRMNSSDTTSGGYASSEMRTYLTNNFLPGLTSAGVPEGVLWAPKREMAAEYSGSGTTRIEDKLWLPTEREMFGMSRYSNDSAETDTNQGRLDYYYNGNTSSFARRVKYYSNLNSSGVPTDSDGWGYWYWEAGPYSASGSFSSSFCAVYGDGHTYPNSAGNAGGCAPAFCVAY